MDRATTRPTNDDECLAMECAYRGDQQVGAPVSAMHSRIRLASTEQNLHGWGALKAGRSFVPKRASAS